MFPAQISPVGPEPTPRCGDASTAIAGERDSRDQDTRADVNLARDVNDALWKDGVLRALDYSNIAIRVTQGVVALYGHVTSTANRRQAQDHIGAMKGVAGVNNHLVADDRLLSEVATALGLLEHTYNCKLFTGVSHGVVLLSGTVDNADTKSLAEKCAASNPEVRGVINSVQVRGSDAGPQDQPFLQPSVDAEFFFLDGLSGRVRQVVIDPDNRLVTAITLQGRFADPWQDPDSLSNVGSPPPESTLVLPITEVRYLTTDSGFLNIRSNERDRYSVFDPAHFVAPNSDWNAPYPYCPCDVLFPAKYEPTEHRGPDQLPPSFALSLADQGLRDQLLENDSLGG